MSDFEELYDSFKRLTSAEKNVFLNETFCRVIQKIENLSVNGIDPVGAVAGFVIGSVTADGRLNEKEYLIIYPTLVKVFGEGFDFGNIKSAFSGSKDSIEAVKRYTENMIRILGLADNKLKEDIIMLCLCIVSTDGKVTQNEKRYIRSLFEASR